MTVRELRAYLLNLPTEMDDAEVVLQQDSEGNGYRFAQEADANCVYDSNESWCCEIYDKEEAPNKYLKNKALVLVPVN